MQTALIMGCYYYIGILIIIESTFDRMISGAKYSGVPHNVHVRPFTRLAKPKSVICCKKKEKENKC